MSRVLSLTLAALAVAPIAFAKAAESASPAVASDAKFLPIRTDIPMPELKPSTRGGQSIYPFDKLDAPTVDKAGKIIGMASFGLIGKTAKSMASTVSSANKRNRTQAKNDDGTPKFDVSTVNGTEIKTPVMVQSKEFKATNVDPAKDPDKATVRIFRTK